MGRGGIDFATRVKESTESVPVSSGREKFEAGFAHGFFTGITDHCLRRLVEVNDPQVQIKGDYAVGDSIEYGLHILALHHAELDLVLKL